MRETTKTSKTLFYPASYLVMTVTSLLLIAAVSGLGGMLIHYWLKGVSGILNDVILLYWLASIVVLLPIHLLSYWQVRHTNKQQVTIFSLRFAHGLLGAYLFITVGSVISLATWLVALWFNALFGAGEADKALLAASLSLGQAIAWLAYATWHFMRARADRSRPKFYVLTVSLLSIMVLTLSFLYPVMAYRDVARDFVKETDLGQLNQAIDEYVDTHAALPLKTADLSGLNSETTARLQNYDYTARGGTKFGIFGYTLCTTFARSNQKGHDTGLGFSSHSAGKQCFTRTTISFTKMNQDLTQDMKNVSDGAVKLQAAIQDFMLGAKKAVDQEVTGIEGFASGQVKQLEGNLEGLEGGTTELQQEMQRLEGNLTGLQGNTGSLAQDFAAVQQFLHDLGCLFGGCKP